jgi:predicted N-acyltransferase
MNESNYVIEVHDSMQSIEKTQWNGLLLSDSVPTPFLRYEYLNAMHESASAISKTGWTCKFITLSSDGELFAACPLYLKTHSYGEYVFDWAWAQAYERHGLHYYPKALIAPPFSPVPGTRLLAKSQALKTPLLKAVLDQCLSWGVSSLHMLYASPQDMHAAQECHMLERHTVQFHWQNTDCENKPFEHFDAFLLSMNQEKRKKIKQERKKVSQAEVSFKTFEGTQIKDEEWDFFYRCYQQTYLEHGNAPYLTPSFFDLMKKEMTENWVMFIAYRQGNPIACSLVAIQRGEDQKAMVAYGRYWGALERVDCLHFEACYYQPIVWCIEKGVERFEGGAQGEHKMARALLPVMTQSAHWLAHPSFAKAVDEFLIQEGQHVNQYVEHLEQRSPYKFAPKSK